MRKKLIVLCVWVLLCPGLSCKPVVHTGAPGGSGPQALAPEYLELARSIREAAADSPYLGGIHARNGLACQDCHQSALPGPDDLVETSQCLACHASREALAEKTGGEAARKWGNPHQSHLGDLECSVCHKAHEASSVYCLGCHTNAPFSIPGE